jgi:hypothetical protein
VLYTWARNVTSQYALQKGWWLQYGALRMFPVSLT